MGLTANIMIRHTKSYQEKKMMLTLEGFEINAKERCF